MINFLLSSPDFLISDIISNAFLVLESKISLVISITLFFGAIPSFFIASEKEISLSKLFDNSSKIREYKTHFQLELFIAVDYQ